MSRVLIANRGEIAIRIARTCRALDIETVAVYSDADRFAEHTKYCDFAAYIGASAPSESYLSIDKILSVAKSFEVDFIHPGYGFLSENAEFVRRCSEAQIGFIGPSPENIEKMGDKIQARETVDALGVPRVPGSQGEVTSSQEAIEFGQSVGFPVLLKAKAGGGGKGMRRVDSADDLERAFEAAQREAKSAFGDGSLYLEKLVLNPHHVEVQIFGDGQGKAIHLGERECSVQRRHQKVFEETPSPILERFPETRQKMYSDAVKIAESIRYAGAGTIEFIVDEEGHFYFLEMNTRLQVEHPVTEWVTGVDLVAWQVQLAQGTLKLPSSVETHGWSMESRVYAEDSQTFLPAPGKLGEVTLAQGAFVRSDSAFHDSGEVSVHYDPMISKVSVWGRDRQEALGRMRVALDEMRVERPRSRRGLTSGSLKTNLTFLRKLLRHPALIEGRTVTSLIADHPELTSDAKTDLPVEAAIAASLFQLWRESDVGSETDFENSLWARRARTEGVES